MDNERIQNALPVEGAGDLVNGVNKKVEHPRFSECFSITEAVKPLFRDFGYKKGDIIQPNQIRDVLIQYGETKVFENLSNFSITILEFAKRRKEKN